MVNQVKNLRCLYSPSSLHQNWCMGGNSGAMGESQSTVHTHLGIVIKKILSKNWMTPTLKSWGHMKQSQRKPVTNFLYPFFNILAVLPAIKVSMQGPQRIWSSEAQEPELYTARWGLQCSSFCLWLRFWLFWILEENILPMPRGKHML